MKFIIFDPTCFIDSIIQEKSECSCCIPDTVLFFFHAKISFWLHNELMEPCLDLKSIIPKGFTEDKVSLEQQVFKGQGSDEAFPVFIVL